MVCGSSDREGRGYCYSLHDDDTGVESACLGREQGVQRLQGPFDRCGTQGCARRPLQQTGSDHPKTPLSRQLPDLAPQF